MREDIEDRSAHMRKIPEDAFKWMEGLINENRIIYKRHGRYATCFCTKCGEIYTACVKRADTFEGQFETLYMMPMHNQPGSCNRCGARGIFKASGKYRGETIQKDVVIGQRHGDDFVWRVFKISQVIYGTDFRPLYTEKSRKIFSEYIRWWCVKGKKPQKDYLLHSWSRQMDEWYPHNIGGMNNIPFPWYAPMYKGTKKEIKDTPMFKYVPDPPYNIHTVNYYTAAARYYKDFEFIAKNKLDAIERGLISGTVGYRQNGKTPEARLGIYKERLKEVIKTNSVRYLDIFKWEKQFKAHWTEADIKAIKDVQGFYYWNDKFIKLLLQYSTPAKVGRYLAKMNGVDKWQERNEYKDYIDMRIRAGYDLTNEIFLFPKDLHRRHNEMVMELEKEKIDKRKKEVLEKFTKIKLKYNRLSDKYSAAAGGLIIRPAKDAAEIVEEGRILHHCVGGDNYLSSHNSGRSFILFLRKIKEKDLPYITVEIRGEEVVQWYGAYDRKPDKQMIEAWLEKYIKELKKHEKMLKKAKKSSKTKQNVQKTA